MTKVEVRPAQASEAAVCRMLLPESAKGGLHEFLVAALPEPPYIGGAAAFVRVAGGIESMRIHVIATLRRQGVGLQLLQGIREAAHGAPVSGWVDAVTEAEGMAFATHHGFTASDRISAAECSEDAVRAYFEPFRRRWEARTNGMEIAMLPQTDRREVARLLAEHIIQLPGVSRLAAEELANPCYDYSPVLLSNGKPVGVLLDRSDTDPSAVLAVVLAPEVRNRTTYAALYLKAFDGVERGHRRVRFEWHSRVISGGKQAQRLGARVVSERVLMTLAGGRGFSHDSKRMLD